MTLEASAKSEKEGSKIIDAIVEVLRRCSIPECDRIQCWWSPTCVETLFFSDS